MNEIAEQEIYQLLSDAFDLDEGDEQIALTENAVRLADLEGDLETQYFAREQLVRACIFGGVTEKALVAFSWCLAQFDQNPGKFSEWAILWKYKWIVGLIRDFPQVPKARIYEMLDDLGARSQRAGYGLRAVLNQRYRNERFWDNKEKAIEYFRKMEEEPRDALSNCSACELDDRVGFSVYCGNDERALELAQPLLNGNEKCATVPHRTYANILLPLIRLGRLEEARQYHQKGYELIAGNKSFLDKVAEHLIFLTLTGNYARAVEIFEKHYPWMEKNRDAFYHFRFFRAAWFLFEMLAEQPNKSLAEPQLSLPRFFPLYSEAGEYDAAKLAAWFQQKTDEIAKRFDQRNETDFFARTLAETTLLRTLRTPFPLVEKNLVG
jgi:tetratricopeptide (TPR) repeat protein